MILLLLLSLLLLLLGGVELNPGPDRQPVRNIKDIEEKLNFQTELVRW